MSAQILALLAALSIALGMTLQQRGTLSTTAKEGDPHFLLELFRKPVWLLGGLFQFLGWILQAIALARGSLVVVQSLMTLSLVFALPLGVRLTGQHVGRRSIIGAAVTLVGIIALIVVGQPQGGISDPPASACLLAGLLLLVLMVLLAVVARRRRGPVAAALFGVAAGLSFGYQSAATKVFMTVIGTGVAGILSSWTPYALVASALAGFGLQQSSLKTGFLAPAMAATNASILVTSVALGVVLFEETLSRGQGLLPIGLISLALAIFGVALLASPDPAAPLPAID
jgi:drug/metabolite transporter (DMT)-like permease